MDQSTKINFLVVPISLVIAAVVATILGVTGQNWTFYIIGVLTGLMNHGLLVKQNARLTRLAKLDPEGKTFNAQKTSMLWLGIRALVFVAIFIALAFKADFQTDSTKAAISVIIAFGGYLTSKIVFIVLLFIFGRDVKKE